MKTLIAIRHVPFEDLGTLEPLLRRRGYTVHYYDIGVHELWTLDVGKIDLLIVLGGPIGAYDEQTYPFLKDELELISQRLDARLPLLGICLGAQLMARALGAAVRPMGVKEIGFAPVNLTDAGHHSVLAALPLDVPVLHWHRDQFDIPSGAHGLAYTEICPHQAFALGDHALGLQFHLEADAKRIEQWLVAYAAELMSADINPCMLRAQAKDYGAALEAAGEAVFNAWLDGVEKHS